LANALAVSFPADKSEPPERSDILSISSRSDDFTDFDVFNHGGTRGTANSQAQAHRTGMRGVQEHEIKS
jgi:hypothetical protein